MLYERLSLTLDNISQRAEEDEIEPQNSLLHAEVYLNNQEAIKRPHTQLDSIANASRQEAQTLYGHVNT